MPAQPQHTCQLTIAARPGSLDVIHDLVESLWARQTRLSEADRLRFETAVIEVAGNIVDHAAPGQHGSPEVIIDLTLTAGPDRATARFRDDGRAAEIDLADARMPDTMAERGRGLALTMALADDLTYERSGSANIWTLTCLRTGPGQARRAGSPGRAVP